MTPPSTRASNTTKAAHGRLTTSPTCAIGPGPRPSLSGSGSRRASKKLKAPEARAGAANENREVRCQRREQSGHHYGEQREPHHPHPPEPIREHPPDRLHQAVEKIVQTRHRRNLRQGDPKVGRNGQ